MLANLGVPSLILILVVALLIFGPSKLPEIGRATGNTLKEFKKATNDLMSDNEKADALEKSSTEEETKN